MKRRGSFRDRGGLGESARRTLRAVCEAMLADTDDQGIVVAPPTPLVDRVVTEVDYMVGAGSTDIHRGFEVLCRLINRCPTIYFSSLSSLRELPIPERISALERLESSRIGLLSTLLVAFKIPITMVAYEVGPELAMTGFERENTSIPRSSPYIAPPEGALIRTESRRQS